MGMGHSIAVVNRAKELAEAGWTVAEITRRLPDEFMGIEPAETTVRRWVDADYAERQRQSDRTGGVQTRRWGWHRRLARIRELREAGIGFDAITKLLHLDFDLPLDCQQVERIHRGEFSAETTRRYLGGDRASTDAQSSTPERNTP
jgi:hypothetical protein